MTIEEFFVKEYNDLKKRNDELLKEKLDIEIEFEKDKKLIEIELNEKKSLLNEVVEFLKESRPHFTDNGYLYLDSYFLSGDSQTKAVELLKKLGIKIEEQKEQE